MVVTMVTMIVIVQHVNSIHHNIRASCLNLIGQVISASSDQSSLVAMVMHRLTDGDYRVRRAALEAMVKIVTYLMLKCPIYLGHIQKLM